MTTTTVSIEKIEAYKKTNYIIFNDQNKFAIHIDRYSAPLHALLSDTRNSCAAVITAYNPLGIAQDQLTNQAANKRLFEHANSLGIRIYEGVGVDPEGLWPPEPSFVLLGIDLNGSKLIGKQFQQDAIIFSSDDAVPKLILLR
jgi:Protein of unknown function (DUF3293)